MELHGELSSVFIMTTRDSATMGTLDGGPQMSPVDFKKWQCPLVVIIDIFPFDLKIA